MSEKENALFLLSANPDSGFAKQLGLCFMQHEEKVAGNTRYDEIAVQREWIRQARAVICVLDEFSIGGGTYENLISAAIYYKRPVIFVCKSGYRKVPRLNAYMREGVEVIHEDAAADIVQKVLNHPACHNNKKVREVKKTAEKPGENKETQTAAQTFQFTFRPFDTYGARTGKEQKDKAVNRETSFEAAMHMMQTDRKAAYHTFLKLAQAGDVNAMLLVAAEYESGGIFPRDMNQAEYWYKEGMHSSDAEALYQYGLFCFRKGDYDNAEVALRYAAESHDSVKAIKKLIEWYSEAYEIPNKDAEIDPLLERLIAKGDTKAMIMRGKRLLAGHSKAETAKGMELLKKAARTELEAHMEIADYYIKRKEYNLAESSLRYAAENRNHYAEYLIGYWYFSGKECYRKDYSKAVLWLKRASVAIPEAVQLLESNALKGYR